MMNKLNQDGGVNAIEHRPEMHHKRRSMSFPLLAILGYFF